MIGLVPFGISFQIIRLHGLHKKIRIVFHGEILLGHISEIINGAVSDVGLPSLKTDVEGGHDKSHHFVGVFLDKISKFFPVGKRKRYFISQGNGEAVFCAHLQKNLTGRFRQSSFQHPGLIEKSLFSHIIAEHFCHSRF